MKYEIGGTRAFYESAPQYKNIAHRHTPVGHVIENYKRVKGAMTAQPVSPDSSALEFYALNHAAAILRSKFTPHEKLPTWADKLMARYSKCLALQGERLFYYILLVTTRESRHLKNLSAISKSIISASDEHCVMFNKLLKGSSSDGAVQKLLDSPPPTTIGPYVRSLETVFYKGSFIGGYGGPPWGAIAATLSSFIEGETSMEMMVDTAYTLAHNNGPMFNKGMLYTMYTSSIYKILDVQRSGQIPELILNHKEEGFALPPGTESLRTLMEEFNSETKAFGSYVDWYKVEGLGSLHKYPMEKNKQNKKVGVVAEEPKVSKTSGPAKAKPKPSHSTTLPGHQYVTSYDVFPGQAVGLFWRDADTV